MKKIFSGIWAFFKILGKTITVIRNIILNVIVLLCIILILFSLAGKGKEATELDADTVLVLNISGNIVEQKRLDTSFSETMDNIFGHRQPAAETLLQDVIRAIKYAENDSRITLILLDISHLGACTLDQLQEIGAALNHFRAGGKKVIAAGDRYSQKGYFLASYASEILLNPTGSVDLHGFAASSLYFKEALDKLHVHCHIFKVGTYKSAVEPFSRNSMSDEAKEQNNVWLTALWEEYCNQLVANRDITRSSIDAVTNTPSLLLENSGGDMAELALHAGLIDAVTSRAEVRRRLADLSAPDRTSGFRRIALARYLKQLPDAAPKDPRQPAVAILVAQGEIVNGTQLRDRTGSETMLHLIRKAVQDETIKAVVLRINSGGGSVTASEMIREELQEIRDAGKPFVVSMSGIAASGAYWISAEADEIWAYPVTLTGSIGIFGIIPTFEDSLGHLGISSDGIGTTNLATAMNIAEPLTDEMKKVIQMNIDNGYRKFIDIVANGRKMVPEEIEPIAEGRVFDGRTALQNGLVDRLGSLDNAVASAAAMAGLTDYSVQYLEEEESTADKLLKQIFEQAGRVALRFDPHSEVLQKAVRYAGRELEENPLLLLQDPRSMYALCPCRIKE